MDRLREPRAATSDWQDLADLQVTFSAGVSSHLAEETTQEANARTMSRAHGGKSGNILKGTAYADPTLGTEPKAASSSRR